MRQLPFLPIPMRAAVVVLVGGLIGPSLSAAERPTKASVAEAIREGAIQLGYDADVGDRLNGLVAGWRCDSMAAERAAARQAPMGGSPAREAAAESRVVDALDRKVREDLAQARAPTRHWHLPEVLADRRAQCLGFCQVWWIVGRAVGLDVVPIEVLTPAEGTLAEYETHVAALVRLADGTVRMIDPRMTIGGSPFRLGVAYRRTGAIWSLADPSNRLGLHRRIRLLDAAGLRAELLMNIANTYRRGGKDAEADPLYEDALASDPDNASLHLAVSETWMKKGRWDDADAEILAALAVDPDSAAAYAAQGRLRARQYRWTEAIAAFDRAITLNPRANEAMAARARAVARLEAARAARPSDAVPEPPAP